MIFLVSNWYNGKLHFIATVVSNSFHLSICDRVTGGGTNSRGKNLIVLTEGNSDLFIFAGSETNTLSVSIPSGYEDSFI